MTKSRKKTWHARRPRMVVRDAWKHFFSLTIYIYFFSLLFVRRDNQLNDTINAHQPLSFL